jgi:hypothetical protein
MEKLLFAAGSSFLRVFGVSLLMFATGILGATDVHTAVALSIAALLASLAAGLRAIQVFVPLLSWASVVKNKVVASWADAFTRAALASLIAFATGWLAAPDYATWKSVWLAAVIGALTAGVRALQGLLTAGHDPAPNQGF